MAKKTKEERQRAKAERKKNKALKREKFNNVVSATKTINIQFDPDSDKPKFVDGFNSIWQILKPTLEYAELIRITGPKADAGIRAVLDLGARISTGNASEQEKTLFIQKYDTIWGFASQALEIIKTFTDDKADEVIDKVIDIGDWMASQKP
jgi:nucleosome binding factor SPN SPT16 subunit